MKTQTSRRLRSLLTCSGVIALSGLVAGGSLVAQTPARGGAPARAGAAGRGTPSFADDVSVVAESQESALEQAKESRDSAEDPAAQARWDSVIKDMEKAAAELKAAANSPTRLTAAQAAQQAAYQNLLRMQSLENQVSRGGQRGGRGGQQAGAGNQGQLNQLDLSQNENRYETQRDAQQQQQQSQERNEQLQVANRLAELARRQEAINERMQELQTALQQARTEQEREQARRELKRLQEDQQQMLSDVDELRQRMDSQQNQTAMSEQRQQLDQVRQNAQNAAEAAAQGNTSQALASGTRAERGLQQAREDLRRQTSSQFEEQLRELRTESRELSSQMRQLNEQLASSTTPGQRRSLADPASSPDELMKQLNERKDELQKIVDQAKEISVQAENTEPLLAQNLDETVRNVATDDLGAAKQFRQRLAEEGRLSSGGNLDRLLQDKNAPEGSRALDLTREMVRQGDRTTAAEAGRVAQAGVDKLRDGIERAAASVLGDDAQALRMAQDELSRAIDQASNEANQNRPGQQGQNGQQGQPGQQGQQGQGQQGQGQQGQPGQGQGQQTAQNQPGQGQQGQGQQGQGQQGQGQQGQGQGQQQMAQNGQGQQGQGQQGQGQQGQGQGRQGQQTAQNQPGQGQQGQGQQGQQGGQGQGRAGQQPGRQGQPQTAQQGGRGGNGRGSVANNAAGPGGARVGNDPLNLNNLLGGGLNPNAGAANAGPITGEGFANWSDGLRNVEEIVDTPEWRNAVAAARERARLLRLEYNRNGTPPDWAKVELDIVKPLTEVRQRIAEELARRDSDNPSVVIDRDPVPTRHTAAVQKYSEEVGKGVRP